MVDNAILHFYQIITGHVRVVQALIKKGALLHRDHNGNTPAHLAAKNGHRDTMKLILNVHSHLLDQTDKDGVSGYKLCGNFSMHIEGHIIFVHTC